MGTKINGKTGEIIKTKKNPPTLHRLEEAQFADILVAMGSLSLADIPCKMVKSPGWGGALLVTLDDMPIAGCYRDGATYKVKSEVILEYIEKHGYLNANNPVLLDESRDAEAAASREEAARLRKSLREVYPG